MIVTLAYIGRSGLRNGGRTNTLSLVPNLARDPVTFDAPLLKPLRFREAISALHDVVINDLRFKPRDKTSYEAWKKGEQQRLNTIRTTEFKRRKKEILTRQDAPLPPDLEKNYHRHRKQYWAARQKYANYLLRHDEALWRMLMPCDPVITVADDVVFFECFSADESSYGCLTVNRQDGFGNANNASFGTTNVDYSWNLFHQFQSLRSYRETRFNIDPTGFKVATQGNEDYREEKIDLPGGWLRGFMQMQGAMGLPMRKVTLSRESVYSLLAWLKRRKAKTSPRAIRFELQNGKPPRLALEPWEQTIVSRGTRYEGPESDGPDGDIVRIWGRRRLLVLARLLPLADRIDVYLLGTGMPSFWVVQMGEMRLTVGLSGWTTNDWTRGSALDVLAPPVTPDKDLIENLASYVKDQGRANLQQISSSSDAAAPECAAAMNRLAHTGQVIFDLHDRVYRWRQIMPQEIAERDLGPENAEWTESKRLVALKTVHLESTETTATGLRLYKGKVGNYPAEVTVDGDSRICRGKCLCGHHQRAGIRMGPCRHLLALRAVVLEPSDTEHAATSEAWYNRLAQWSWY